MIELVMCIRRRPELSEAEFRRYWLEDHADLVKRLIPILGVQRYVQMHTTDTPATQILRESRGCPDEDWDGIAVLSWPTKGALEALADSDEALQASAALLEDEARFIDLANCRIWVSDSHVIFDSASGPGGTTLDP